MNLAVFFPEYEPLHCFKDPGQLVLGLNEIGCSSQLITTEKPSLRNHTAIPLRFATVDQMHDPGYWSRLEFDAIIAYTWLRPEFLWIVDTIKKGGKRLIVKADTDGRLGFPVYPGWDRYIWNDLSIVSFLKILRRRLRGRLRGRRHAALLSAHLGLANFVIVESPQALVNLTRILTHWRQPEHSDRILVIPNPVSTKVSQTPLTTKRRRIVAIGNWAMRFGNYQVKNPRMLCKVLCRFLASHQEYEAVIIGNGREVIERFLKAESPIPAGRVRITGPLDHDEVVQCLAESRMLFLPSLSEGFSIAASEALCLGCSVTGSPLECLNYFSQGGFSGTLARGFGRDAYLEALSADAAKWEIGAYSAEGISSFWRRRLNRGIIASQFLELARRP